MLRSRRALDHDVKNLIDVQPCVGIPRMKRWARANKLSLHPPIEVLAVLLSEEEKGNPKSQRAHIDELISSRFVTE